MLETNVGSEIICFVTDRLRSRLGVERPLTRPGEGIAADVGDIGGADICAANVLSPGIGDGLGDGRGVKSPFIPGAAKDFESKYVCRSW